MVKTYYTRLGTIFPVVTYYTKACEVEKESC